MSIKVSKSKIDLEITNEKGNVFVFQNIEVTSDSMGPFRTILLLAEADYQTVTKIPLPKEWHKSTIYSTSCVDSAFLCYSPEEGIWVELKGLGRNVRYEITVEEIKQFYTTDEFDNGEGLSDSSLVGLYDKKVGITSDLLVTDKETFVLLIDEDGIRSIFHNLNPYGIVDERRATKEQWRKQSLFLPSVVRAVYDGED